MRGGGAGGSQGAPLTFGSLRNRDLTFKHCKPLVVFHNPLSIFETLPHLLLPSTHLFSSSPPVQVRLYVCAHHMCGFHLFCFPIRNVQQPSFVSCCYKCENQILLRWRNSIKLFFFSLSLLLPPTSSPQLPPPKKRGKNTISVAG